MSHIKQIPFNVAEAICNQIYAGVSDPQAIVANVSAHQPIYAEAITYVFSGEDDGMAPAYSSDMDAQGIGGQQFLAILDRVAAFAAPATEPVVPPHPTPWKVEYRQRFSTWHPQSRPEIMDANNELVLSLPCSADHPGVYDPVAVDTAQQIVDAVNSQSESL